MLCPNCATGMKEKQYEELPIHFCPDCKGVWISDEELALLASRQIDEIDPSILEKFPPFAGLNFHPEINLERERKMACPECAKWLKLVNYQYSSGIIVNRCPGGCGVFLDAGELEAIQAYAEQGDEKLEQMDQYYKTISSSAANHVNTELGGKDLRIGYKIGRLLNWILDKWKTEHAG